MDIEEESGERVTVLRPVGRLDSHASRDFETRVMRVVDSGAGAMVIDCGGLEYISSAGLRVLLLAAKNLKPAGRKIVLCTLRENVQEVFDVSGFSSLFEVYGTRDAALAAAD